MRLSEMFFRVRNGWRIILACSIVMLLLMVILMKVTNPVYSITATIMAPNSPITKSSALSGAGGIAASLLGRGVNSPQEYTQFLARLQSQPVAAKMEADHHVLQLLYPEQWDGERGRWRPKTGFLVAIRNVVYGFFGLAAAHPPTVEDLTLFLKKNLITTEGDDPSVYTVSLKYKNAQVGADIVRWDLEAAEALEKSNALGPTKEYIHYIINQARLTSDPALRTALGQLFEEQQQRAMALGSHAAYGAQIINPPIAPTRPVWPSPVLGALIAIIVGTIIGMVITVMKPDSSQIISCWMRRLVPWGRRSVRSF